MNPASRNEPPVSRSVHLAVSGIPVLLYLALALPGLATTSLWLDEIMSLDFISEPSAIDVLVRLRGDTHAPIFFVIGHAVTNVLGVSEGPGRLTAVLFGVLTILGLDRLTRELRWPAGQRLAAGLLLASSPFVLEFSREVRPYSTAAFFVVMSWWALVRLLKRPTLRDAALYGMALGGTVLSFYLGLLSLFGQLAVVLALRPCVRKWKWLAAGAVFGALIGSIWIPALLAQIENARERPQYTITSYFPNGTGLRDVLALVVDGVSGMALRNASFGVALAFAAMAILLACAGFVRATRGPRRARLSRTIAFWGIAGPFVAFVVLCLITPIPLSRYLAPQGALLALFLVAGAIFALRSRRLRIAALALAVALQVASCVFYHTTLPRTDWRGVALELASKMAPRDVVVTGNVTMRSCLSMSLRFAGHERFSPNVYDYRLFHQYLPSGRLRDPDQRLWYLGGLDAPPEQLHELLGVYEDAEHTDYAGGLKLHALKLK